MIRYHLYYVQRHVTISDYGFKTDGKFQNIKTYSDILVVQLSGNYALVNNDVRLNPTQRVMTYRYLAHDYETVDVDFSKLPAFKTPNDLKVLDTAPSGYSDDPHLHGKPTRPDYISFLRGGVLLRIGRQHFWHFKDDKMWFTIKVPCSIKTIKDAEHYMTPDYVKERLKKGAVVYRYGELWFVHTHIHLNFRETKRQSIPQINDKQKHHYFLKLRKYRGKLYASGRVSHCQSQELSHFNPNANAWSSTTVEIPSRKMRGFNVYNTMEVVKSPHGKI